MQTVNLFKNIPTKLTKELIEVLVSAQNVRIERIVSRGHASPDSFWYDQKQSEFVLLLQGQAEIQFFDPDVHLGLETGDSLIIPAHQQPITC